MCYVAKTELNIFYYPKGVVVPIVLVAPLATEVSTVRMLVLYKGILRIKQQK
ncbi:MAG: hypothetical protein ACFCUL_06295 [Flavobacteriaceae bacterium]